MCGRYATTRSDTDLSILFDAVNVTEGLEPSWNVAPTDPVPVIRNSARHDARVLDTAKWGLLPPWVSDPRAAARMINARAETVATTRAYAPSFAKRRCLVPADGWYEWTGTGKQKQAYYMTARDGSPLAFAGLWSKSADLLTTSVVTTAALGQLTAVHSRMPLILPADRWADWLAGGGDPHHLLAPMTPAELDFLEVRPVRRDVGNVRNNGPDLITQMITEPEQESLF